MRRVLIALPICLLPILAHGLDSDGDGVPDASDNCPFAYNPAQTDAGGIGSQSAPDGIGDACQCGDLNGDGVVSVADVSVLGHALANEAPYQNGIGYGAFQLSPQRCDVNADGRCDTSDKSIINRVTAGITPPSIQQSCLAAIGERWQIPAQSCTTGLAEIQVSPDGSHWFDLDFGGAHALDPNTNQWVIGTPTAATFKTELEAYPQSSVRVRCIDPNNMLWPSAWVYGRR